MMGAALRKLLMQGGEKGAAMLGKLGSGAKKAGMGAAGMAKEALPLYAALTLSDMTTKDDPEEMGESPEEEMTESEYDELLKKIKQKQMMGQ